MGAASPEAPMSRRWRLFREVPATVKNDSAAAPVRETRAERNLLSEFQRPKRNARRSLDIATRLNEQTGVGGGARPLTSLRQDPSGRPGHPCVQSLQRTLLIRPRRTAPYRKTWNAKSISLPLHPQAIAVAKDGEGLDDHIIRALIGFGYTVSTSDVRPI